MVQQQHSTHNYSYVVPKPSLTKMLSIKAPLPSQFLYYSNTYNKGIPLFLW